MELTPEQVNTLKVFTSKGGAFDIVSQIAKEHLEKKRDMFVKNTINNTDTNEALGAKFKAFTEGLKLVDEVFREISQYRSHELKGLERNPAR